jgi:hypothetical protein
MYWDNAAFLFDAELCNKIQIVVTGLQCTKYYVHVLRLPLDLDLQESLKVSFETCVYL